MTDQGRGKRTAELVELAVKAHDMKLQRIDEDDEDPTIFIASKLSTEKGKIPRPENIQSWSYDFSKMPPFTFADLYTYLIGSGEYTAENLKSFKSALVQVILRWLCSRLYMMHCVKDMSYTLFKFKVLPTERSKTDDNKLTYNGFLIMDDSGVFKDGFCPCKGR